MPALAATVHDPAGRMLPLLRRHLDRLRAYEAVAVAATPQTAGEVRRLLGDAGARLVAGGADVGAARRAALAALAPPALDAVPTKIATADGVLACDFDRWLAWAETHPAELGGLPTRIKRRTPRPWYVCLGRTPSAFASHPEVQRRAEAATNRALSVRLGRRLDATAGAAWLSPEGVALVRARSVEATNATDLEWPALVFAADPRRLAGLRCDGLAFETPWFFPAEVAAAGGVDAWVRVRYGAPRVWAERLRLAADSVAALDRVLGATPVRYT